MIHEEHTHKYKLITLIIPGHKTIEIMEGLIKEKYITTANKVNARGISNASGDSMEMEVLTVMIESDLADEIFDYLYHKAEIYHPSNGLIFQQSLAHVTEYSL